MSKIIYDHEIENLCFKLSILGKDRIAIQDKGLTDKAAVKSILETMLKERPKPAERRITQFNRLYKLQSRQAKQKAKTDAFLRSSEEAERKRDSDKAAGYDPSSDVIAEQLGRMWEDGEITTEAYEQTMTFLGIPLPDAAQNEAEPIMADVPF